MRPALSLAIAFSLIACGCSRAQSDPAFDRKVHDYLLAHPEMLEEMSAKLQEKKQAAADARGRAALKEKRQALEHDARDFVANPSGRITLTEFYDYRCPHCINAAPAVMDIIKSDPDVRVVFKELPIFGDVSDRAAQAAIAVKRQGGDYIGVWHDFMTTKPLDNAAIDRILRARGVDPKVADAADPATRKQLADVQQLAQDLGIEGTPAFIVGNTIVPGEDMEAVRAAIAAERKKKT